MNSADAADALAAELISLREPADGTPAVVDTQDAYRDMVHALAAGTGPIAVDAERASGYRYGQRAYLVQFRRENSGTHLLDPVAFANVNELAEVIADCEWVLHAASQDLPCLDELGLRPHATIFDTELAARLVGRARVGLGPLLEDTLGISLAKEHSAVNWSTRPLPEPWLRYAALDVEVLLELRDVMERELFEAGKLQWAREEFAHIAATSRAVEPGPDRWRRTSGLHKVRGRRALGVVRELWRVREEIAEKRDVHPSRVLKDAALCEAAISGARTMDELLRLSAWSARSSHRDLRVWLRTIDEAYALTEDQLPVPNPPSDAPPQPRMWAERDPVAHARLLHSRAAVTHLSESLSIPAENLMTPDFVRRLAWAPPSPLSEQAVDQRSAALGARAWQRGLLVGPLTAAFHAGNSGVPAPTPTPTGDQAGADSDSNANS